MIGETYRERVLRRLAEKSHPDPLSEFDEETIAWGEIYNIGPGDCAVQIIDNRSEQLELEETF